MTTQEGLPALATDAEVNRAWDLLVADGWRPPSNPTSAISEIISSTRRSAASAEPAVAVKPAKLQIGVDAYKAENAKHGWTGRGYSLDPFFLNLNRDGGASVGFAEEDANYERDDETGRAYIFCNSPVSEVLELRDYLNEAFPLASPPPSPVVSEAMVTAALYARVPGGAEVWHWFPQTAGNTPHETARNVMRAALTAALSPVPAGEVGWRTGDTVWRYKLHMSDAWTYTERPLSPKELGPSGRQEKGHFPTGGDKP